MSKIRTRFAPSPTGFLHIGGLRTALYDYLIAKKHNGSFVLRIEDTDQNRFVEGGIENIIDGLHWAGIDYNEGPLKDGNFGPYIQSECLEIYKKHAQELLDKGLAYYCFCTTQRLDEVRQRQIAAKLPPAYDRSCRDLSKEEVEKRIASGEKYVIRMRVPLDGEITFNDVVRGNVTIKYKVIDDQVIVKSDGFPTYHLAVVVDDHRMEISHVIRGEEWLPSTPKHLLLYQYFGWQPPLFAHVPLILNPDKSKLSKRHGDVSVESYKQKGYLPEAIVNFVVLLGWNPGDTREIFTLEELVQEFSLERIHKAGAIFNIEKLNWLNHQHILRKTNDELLKIVKPWFIQKGFTIKSDDFLLKVMELIKERVTVLPDFVTYSEFFFTEPTTFDEKTKAKCWNIETVQTLQRLVDLFEKLTTFDAPSTEQALRNLAAELNLNATKIIQPARLALTGMGQGPSLFHMIEVLGKETTLKRIEFAIKNITI